MSRRNIKKLQALKRNRRIDLWAIDEARFEQYGSACRMWIPPEIKDPVLLHHPTRKSVGYFGAVRLRDGKFVYRREENRFNGETFFGFLKHLRRISSHSGRRAVLILDNVKYHHACLHKEWREKNKRKFVLEFMPPYSPELNPIERVWKLTRRKATHNRYFPSLQEVMYSVEDAFDQWRLGNQTLRKLCAIN
jgi:transposase